MLNTHEVPAPPDGTTAPRMLPRSPLGAAGVIGDLIEGAEANVHIYELMDITKYLKSTTPEIKAAAQKLQKAKEALDKAKQDAEKSPKDEKAKQNLEKAINDFNQAAKEFNEADFRSDRIGAGGGVRGRGDGQA